MMLLECLILNSGHVDFLRCMMMNVQMLLFATCPAQNFHAWLFVWLFAWCHLMINNAMLLCWFAWLMFVSRLNMLNTIAWLLETLVHCVKFPETWKLIGCCLLCHCFIGGGPIRTFPGRPWNATVLLNEVQYYHNATVDPCVDHLSCFCSCFHPNVYPSSTN